MLPVVHFCLKLDMKVSDGKMKAISVTLMAAILLLASCTKNNDILTSTDVENVNSESVSDSYISEASDLGNSVISTISATTYATGRVSTDITGTLASVDGRLSGAAISIDHSGCANSILNNPCGKITIDFKTGVTTNGVTRKGKIVISYSGRKDSGQSTRALHFHGYTRNGIVFDSLMVFTLTNTAAAGVKDSLHFHYVLDSGKLTFPDYTTMTRVSNFYVTLDYVARTVTLSAAPFSTAHNASGTTRAGKAYTMDIKTPLVYSANCLAAKAFIPVGGEKFITAASATYTINYGDGATCDNIVTIVAGGKNVTITVNGDGN